MFKKVRLNSQELPLLAISLNRNSFPRPNKQELFAECYGDGTCSIFFESEYYSRFINAVKDAFEQGKFKQSNAESDWVNFKNLIESAETVVNIDLNSLKEYELL